MIYVPEGIVVVVFLRITNKQIYILIANPLDAVGCFDQFNILLNLCINLELESMQIELMKEKCKQLGIRCLCFDQLQMLPNILQEALLITFIWEYVWLNEITYFNIIDKQQFIRYNYIVRNKQIVTKVVIQIDIIKLYSENYKWFQRFTFQPYASALTHNL